MRASAAPLGTVAAQVPYTSDHATVAVLLGLVATTGFALVSLALPRLPQTRGRLRFCAGVMGGGSALFLASFLLGPFVCPPRTGLFATCGAAPLLVAGIWAGTAVAGVGLASLLWTLLAAVWGRLWLWTL